MKTTSATFIPLVSAASATAPAFQPLHVKLAQPALKADAGNGSTRPHEKCPAPKVTLQRDNDVVTGIRIECACGQVIDLACVY